ncbi:MAG: caspase family protein, partial [Planctomycetia bacterium]|nr:caspase family protein [Planctomycetia bacterium]
MRRGARLLAGALLALLAPRPACAAAPRTFALLVGCTTYPFLARALDAATYDARVRLRGPEADVAAFADVLTTTLAVPRAHVTTLVGWDDRAPLENPTRENVLRGLLRLARTVAPGDRVVFLFAGHGSRVPDGSGDEPDGFDEVLLPADVRTFEPEGRRVPGAILDDEVGQRLRAIRDAGATVWAVFDCCHAGTMARGGDGPTRARDLPGALLGVPAPATRGAPDASPGAADGDDLRGIAATYAVGPAARAVEMRLPRGAPDAPWRGLLSFALVEDLRRTRGAGDLAALDVRLAAAYDAAGFHGASPFTEGDRGLAPSGPGRVV